MLFGRLDMSMSEIQNYQTELEKFRAKWAHLKDPRHTAEARQRVAKSMGQSDDPRNGKPVN